MPLSRKQVQHTARLARLELTPQETDSFTRDLTVIVDFTARLEGVDTSQIDLQDTATFAQASLREDAAAASLPVETALGGAPAANKELLEVPRVIER
jgi:aspartyl-tRNA(Asn)/glutamyl-tRNA(Gln) amidotransferase subunit C